MTIRATGSNRRTVLGFGALAVLAACGYRPGVQVLTPDAAPLAAGARVMRIYTAAPRGGAGAASDNFASPVSMQTDFARYDIAVPADHKPGRIEWARAGTDPADSFTVKARADLTQSAFLEAVQDGSKADGAGIFIHGYNMTFQEALFRLAQIDADAGVGGVPVLFAWPSRGTYAGYLADKEALTASRDQLVSLLAQVVAHDPGKETVVFAHSMGCWLLMEALRQLRLEGRADVLARLRVFLASPDIDGAVFQAQLAVIGKMKKPITIFVAPDDKVLQVSGMVTGAGRRIGLLDVKDPAVSAAAVAYGVSVVDITSVAAGDGMGHDRYAALAVSLRGLEREGAMRQAMFNYSGAYVYSSAGGR